MSQVTRLTHESELHAKLARDLAAESEQLAKELMGELDQLARVSETVPTEPDSRIIGPGAGPGAQAPT